MTANDGRISAAHTGSPPRPPELSDLLTRRQDGEAIDPTRRNETVADTVDDETPLVAAPDCGFDAEARLGMVDPGIAWTKLEALGEGAAIASDRLA